MTAKEILAREIVSYLGSHDRYFDDDVERIKLILNKYQLVNIKKIKMMKKDIKDIEGKGGESPCLQDYHSMTAYNQAIDDVLETNTPNKE